MKMKKYILFLIVLSICPFLAGSQQYNIIRQGVCWTTPTAVDSSLTRLVYVSVSGAGPISVNYINSYGTTVDVGVGGSFEMGYCGCCPAVDSTAIDVLFYEFGDSIFNGDTLISPFNSGDTYYIATTGDNATGRRGYMDIPFTTSPLDSANTGMAHWVYPGTYDIGPGQQFPHVFGTSQNPYVFYAPNSILNFINTGNGYLFRPSGAHNNPYFYLIANKMYLKDLSLIRFFEAGNRGVLSARINQLVFKDSIAGGDAGFVVPAGQIRIDSLYSASRAAIYSTSLTGDKLFFRVGVMQSDQTTTIDGLKSEMIRQGDAFAGPQSNTLFQIDIGNLYATDVARVFSNGHNGEYQNSTLLLKAENSNIRYTGTSVDSTLAQQSVGLTTANNLNYISLIAPDYSGYLAQLDFKNIDSDKFIYVKDNGPNAKINIEIGDAVFRNTRGIQVSNPDPVGSETRVNCRNCVSEQNAVILSYGSSGMLGISGRYETEKAGRPVIYTEKDIYIENAQLYGDGTYPCIQASAPVTVYVRGDLYMNSDSIHPNITFQKIEYGYDDCNGDFIDTQTILDALCDSIAAIPADLNVAEDDLVANGSHTTDWLTHSLTFDYTGAGLDTIVFRWPSPDGEVQGLYISDGAQEMALLMNDVRGTDFANIINYNLADEIVFGNRQDTVVTQADKWFADIQNLVRADTVRSVMVIDSDTEIKLKYVPISGRVSDTTDGSGDIVIPLGVTMGSVNFTALVGARGTTFQQAQVISNTATDITVRVLDFLGVPITGAAVVVDWMVMDY